MRLACAGIPFARQRWSREEEEAGIAQLLLRYGVAADEATADRQAATKSVSDMAAARVERNLEALRFLGWDTQQVSPATISKAGPQSCLTDSVLPSAWVRSAHHRSLLDGRVVQHCTSARAARGGSQSTVS